MAGGIQGPRQTLPPPVQAAAFWARGVRLRSVAYTDAYHPLRHRGRRGDLSDDRRYHATGSIAQHSVLPGDAALPTARATRDDTATIEVVHRVRRAGPN